MKNKGGQSDSTGLVREKKRKNPKGTGTLFAKVRKQRSGFKGRGAQSMVVSGNYRKKWERTLDLINTFGRGSPKRRRRKREMGAPANI